MYMLSTYYIMYKPDDIINFDSTMKGVDGIKRPDMRSTCITIS